MESPRMRARTAHLDALSSEEQLEHLFNLSLDLLCVAGFDGYFKRLNPAWEKTLGFTIDELLAKPYLEFVHPDDRSSTIAEAQKISMGAYTISFENRYRTKVILNEVKYLSSFVERHL